jgi:ribosomal protein L37AE/L43A
MAKTQQKNPPVCPDCGEPLKSVIWEVDPDHYEFKNGSYTLKTEGGGVTRCPHCEADLSDLFPEGPVNYA